MTCSVDACDRTVHSRGMCRMHYMRWYRSGNVEVKQKTPAPHGTAGAYQRHLRLSEQPCEACATWRRDYQKAWRQDHPEAQAKYAPGRLARQRAHARLAREYPERFRELLVEERAR